MSAEDWVAMLRAQSPSHKSRGPASSPRQGLTAASPTPTPPQNLICVAKEGSATSPDTTPRQGLPCKSELPAPRQTPNCGATGGTVLSPGTPTRQNSTRGAAHSSVLPASSATRASLARRQSARVSGSPPPAPVCGPAPTITSCSSRLRVALPALFACQRPG